MHAQAAFYEELVHNDVSRPRGDDALSISIAFALAYFFYNGQDSSGHHMSDLADHGYWLAPR